MYTELLNYIFFVLFAIKANLSSFSSSEEVAFRRRNTLLLTEKPCREVKTTGILFEEKLYGQDQKRVAVYHFPVFSFILVVVATGASVGVWLHLFVL